MRPLHPDPVINEDLRAHYIDMALAPDDARWPQRDTWQGYVLRGEWRVPAHLYRPEIEAALATLVSSVSAIGLIGVRAELDADELTLWVAAQHILRPDTDEAQDIFRVERQIRTAIDALLAALR